MKESISNSYVFTLVIVFVAIISLIIAGSISYSRAFKVKNKLLDIIEKYENFDEDAQKEIKEYLAKSGYKIDINKKECENSLEKEDNYRYCIYKYEVGKGVYYKVTTYMFFDLPLIEGLIEIPINGETRILLPYVH